MYLFKNNKTIFYIFIGIYLWNISIFLSVYAYELLAGGHAGTMYSIFGFIPTMLAGLPWSYLILASKPPMLVFQLALLICLLANALIISLGIEVFKSFFRRS
jgi:hypothetical protein